MGGTPWTFLKLKDNESFYVASFGGSPDKLLLEQLTKPLNFHKYKIQDMNSRLCGTYHLYFSCLRERKKGCDAVLKIVFG